MRCIYYLIQINQIPVMENWNNTQPFCKSRISHLTISAEPASWWEPFMVCQKLWEPVQHQRPRTVGESTEEAQLSVYLHGQLWQHRKTDLDLWSIKYTATWPFHSTVIHLKHFYLQLVGILRKIGQTTTTSVSWRAHMKVKMVDSPNIQNLSSATIT